MKRLLLSFSALAFVFTAGAQTRKVMMEDFTGTWCGWCPEGTVVQEDLEKLHKTNFIPVAVHDGDPMEIADGATLISTLNDGGFPAGAVDRVKYAGESVVAMGRESWAMRTNSRLSTPAIASVSFAKTKYSSTRKQYDAEIQVKFTSAPVAGVPLKINVFVLEDSIAATGVNAQGNSSPDIQGKASPLTNWWHNGVLRKALGGAWGWSGAIPATPAVGTIYKKTMSLTVDPSWKLKNLRLVAYVAYDGTTSDKKEILNAEEIRVTSATFPTVGIGDNVEPAALRVLGIYPNPATATDVLKMEYTTKTSGKVTLRIFNAVGQLVDVPYDGQEVAGAHTIHWRPADKGLAAGLYTLQLSSEDGTTAQQVAVQ